MKQFCRVYLESGTQTIVAVYTNNTNEVPAFEPVTDDNLDMVDLEVDLGEDQPYVRPDLLRQAMEMRNGRIQSKAGSVTDRATITEKQGRRPQTARAALRAVKATRVVKTKPVAKTVPRKKKR